VPAGFSERQSELSGEPGKVLGAGGRVGELGEQRSAPYRPFKRMAELSTLLGEQAQLPETESHARPVAGS